MRAVRGRAAAALLALLFGACSDSPLAPVPQEQSSTLADSGLITYIEAASGRPYAAAEGLADGARVYIDRTYVYKNVPATLKGLTYIRTANGDQALSGSGTFLTFELTRDAVVYVAYHGPATPSWLHELGFRPTGDSIVVAKAAEENAYAIYAATFRAGTIRLGTNRADGGSAQMYTIAVKPTYIGSLVGGVTAQSGRSYEVAYGLTQGAKAYIDRAYTYTYVPVALEGAPYLRTANGDQLSTGNAFLSFQLDRESAVYVAFNGTKVPAWVAELGFQATGDSVVITKTREQNTHLLYGRTFQAGKVVLGGNAGGLAGAEMYTVVIVPLAQAVPDEQAATQPGATEPTSPVEIEPAPQPSAYAAVLQGIRPRGFGQGTYSLLSPAAGGTTYYVSPNGDDANPGTLSAPFRTINKAAQVAQAGDVVTIAAGTYRESVSVRNAGTSERRIVFQAAERGKVVLTGGSYNFAPAQYYGGVKQDGAVYVTLRGLVFRNYAPEEPNIRYRAAVAAIRGWRIEDCLFDDAGFSGLDIRGDSVTVVRSTFENHHTLALTASAAIDKPLLRWITLQDAVLRHNNNRPDPLYGDNSIKVMKFYHTTGTLVDNVESYENNGPGIWFDTNNTNFTVRNSYLHDNFNESGHGLFIEVSHGPGLVENNVFASNSVAGVTVANSSKVTLKGNLFVANPHSVKLVYADRGSAYPLKDVAITHNFFKGWVARSNIHPGGAKITTPADMNVTADYNRYEKGSVIEMTYWKHTGWIRTIADMRAKLGWEANGSEGTVNSPL